MNGWQTAALDLSRISGKQPLDLPGEPVDRDHVVPVPGRVGGADHEYARLADDHKRVSPLAGQRVGLDPPPIRRQLHEPWPRALRRRARAGAGSPRTGTAARASRTTAAPASGRWRRRAARTAAGTRPRRRSSPRRPTASVSGRGSTRRRSACWPIQAPADAVEIVSAPRRRPVSRGRRRGTARRVRRCPSPAATPAPQDDHGRCEHDAPPGQQPDHLRRCDHGACRHRESSGRTATRHRGWVLESADRHNVPPCTASLRVPGWSGTALSLDRHRPDTDRHGLVTDRSRPVTRHPIVVDPTASAVSARSLPEARRLAGRARVGRSGLVVVGHGCRACCGAAVQVLT